MRACVCVRAHVYVQVRAFVCDRVRFSFERAIKRILCACAVFASTSTREHYRVCLCLKSATGLNMYRTKDARFLANIPLS